MLCKCTFTRALWKCWGTLLDYFVFTLLSISTLLHFWRQREFFVFFYFALLYLKLKCPSALLQSGFGASYLYHHFYLKPTRCSKGTTESNPQRCPFRNDRVSAFQKGEAFISNLHTVFKTSTAYLWFFFNVFNYFTATDGLCSLLQNSGWPDGIKPQAVCALHPETKTHRGIHVLSCYHFFVWCELCEQEAFQLLQYP